MLSDFPKGERSDRSASPYAYYEPSSKLRASKRQKERKRRGKNFAVYLSCRPGAAFFLARFAKITHFLQINASERKKTNAHKFF